jgi:hypothetical protein
MLGNRKLKAPGPRKLFCVAKMAEYEQVVDPPTLPAPAPEPEPAPEPAPALAPTPPAAAAAAAAAAPTSAASASSGRGKERPALLSLSSCRSIACGMPVVDTGYTVAEVVVDKGAGGTAETETCLERERVEGCTAVKLEEEQHQGEFLPPARIRRRSATVTATWMEVGEGESPVTGAR